MRRLVRQLGVCSLLLFALAAAAAHAAAPRKAGAPYLPGAVRAPRVLQQAPSSERFLLELDRVRAPLAEPPACLGSRAPLARA